MAIELGLPPTNRATTDADRGEAEERVIKKKEEKMYETFSLSLSLSLSLFSSSSSSSLFSFFLLSLTHPTR